MPDFPDGNDSPTAFEVGAKNSPVNESEPTDGSEAARGADRPTDAKPEAVSTDPKAKSEPTGEARSKTIFRPIDAEGAERIYLAEQQVGIWDARIEEAAEELKAMKASREAAVAAFRRIAREINEAAEPNLFSSSEEPTEEPPCDWLESVAATAEITIVPAKPGDCPIAADESWRDLPLKDLIPLGAPEIVVTRLGEIGVNTLGEFSKWGEPNDQGFQRTIDNQKLRGCGAAKREKFEAAMEEYFATRAVR